MKVFYTKNLKLIWLAVNALMVVGMVIIGGITRLTDSGLSMTEWNLISGIFPPLNLEEWEMAFDKYKITPEYNLKNFGMTLNEFKRIFFWEYFHRVWGRLIGITFLVPLVLFWYFGMFSKYEKKYSLILLSLGIIQAFFGWYMVKSGLVDKPDVSHFRLSLHLCTALIIYSIILFLFWRNIRHPLINKNKVATNFDKFIVLALILSFLTVMSGAFVAGTNAGWSYNNFPMMGDNFLPPILVSQKLPSILIAFNDIGFIQFFHRCLATFTLFFLIFLSLKFIKSKLDNFFRKALITLLFVIVAQYSLGILILKLFVPLSLGLLHQFGSLIIISLLVIILSEIKLRKG